MIDTTVSLVSSVHSAPRRYAILLGSGVSTAAGIPTGWQITLDLISKVAIAYGEHAGDDPSAWYSEKFGQAPSYSAILDELAKTPADRRELLASYIEPKPDDPDGERRQPTNAHRAIASLIRDGFINVVVTTNFDRLLERALGDLDVEPVVLSTPEQVEGALPPSQAECMILKIHGDYLSSSIRNTEAELESYPPPFNKLLDRIIDDFGLIVCGWSGDWDPALRAALERAETRRFATYWAAKGEPSNVAKALIRHRDAHIIEIDDADSFFQSLHDRVAALADFTPPHPESTEVAVASMKRYLSEHRYRIQLRELVDHCIDDVAQKTSTDLFPVTGQPAPTSISLTARLEAYEAASAMLIPLAMVGGSWPEPEHSPMWRNALQRLASRNSGSGSVLLLDLERYPATLLMYALGLGAVHAGKYDFLAQIFATPVTRRYEDPGRAATVLALDLVTQQIGNGSRAIRGYEKHPVPLSAWLHDRLKPYSQHLTRDEQQYTRTFDKLEIFVALNFAHLPPSDQFLDEYVPMGASRYRTEIREATIAEIEESLSQEGDESHFAKSGLFGTTAAECLQALDKFKQNRPRRFGWR